MKKLLCLSLMLFSVNSFAEIFEATGYGETAESARKNAVMNAVKMSVGEFVLNKQELNNEEFTEKTINYSNAYVKSSRVISEEIVNGEYQVKVEVDIESQKLLELLKESRTAKISIDRNKLKNKIDEAEKNSAHNELHHFEQLVDEILIQPIKERKHLPDVKIISEIEPVGTKNLEGKIPFEFEIEIIPSAAYRNNVNRVVEEMKEDSGREYYQTDLYLGKEPRKDPKVVTFNRYHQIRQKIFLNHDKKTVVENKYRTVKENLIGSLTIQLVGNEEQILNQLIIDNNRISNNNEKYWYGEFLNPNVGLKNMREFTSYISSDGVFYVYGKLKLKIRFLLTEDEVDELQDLKVFFS